MGYEVVRRSVMTGVACIAICAGSSSARAQVDIEAIIHCPSTGLRQGVQARACSDPYGRNLLAALFGQYRTLLTINPMRATLRREFHEWSGGAVQAQYDWQIWPRLIDRYHVTRRFIDETRTAMERRYTEDELRSNCADLAPPRFDPLALTCGVVDVRGVGPGVVAQRQRWTAAAGEGASETRPAIAILGVVESSTPRAVAAHRLLGWAAEEHGHILEPYFVDGDGKDFIVIPYQHGGSSGGGHYYVLHRPERTADWHEIDARTWNIGIADRLPRNVSRREAYDIDLLNMTATIHLFRRDLPFDNFRDDGRVEVGLILRGDVLTINSFVLRRPAPATRPAQQRRP